MSGEVSLLRPAVANPATSPALTEALREAIATKRQAAVALLQSAVNEFGGNGAIAFANSLGAEDMVLTDIILRENLPIEIFSLDTGRLPAETYTLIAEVERDREQAVHNIDVVHQTRAADLHAARNGVEELEFEVRRCVERITALLELSLIVERGAQRRRARQ